MIGVRVGFTERVADIVEKSAMRGFTLVELVIVLFLAGIIMLIAIPSYQNYMMQNRLNGAARVVMSDLMHARAQAAGHNNEFKVFFVDNHQYRILDDDDDDGAKDSTETYIIDRNIQTNYYDATLSSNRDIVFQPNGTANGATVTLTNPGGTKTVTVSLPGRVKIN